MSEFSMYDGVEGSPVWDLYARGPWGDVLDVLGRKSELMWFVVD